MGAIDNIMAERDITDWCSLGPTMDAPETSRCGDPGQIWMPRYRLQIGELREKAPRGDLDVSGGICWGGLGSF
jgi:hypothetical protein